MASKIKGLQTWLKAHGYTYDQMQAYWDELIEINPTVEALHRIGINWDHTNLGLVAQLPTEKERTLKRKAEKFEAEEKAKVEAERVQREKEYYDEHFEELMVQKIDTNEDLTERELNRLVCEYNYNTTEGDSGRWTKMMYTVVQLCGRFFEIVWQQGLTEYQENEYLDQPYEVREHTYTKTITVTEWERVTK